VSTITYRAPSTGGYYITASPQVNAVGAPSQVITVGGITYVLCNRDGSMARGTAGPTPPNDPYSPGSTPSLWEQQ
jgi:hypothetical protein